MKLDSQHGAIDIGIVKETYSMYSKLNKAKKINYVLTSKMHMRSFMPIELFFIVKNKEYKDSEERYSEYKNLYKHFINLLISPEETEEYVCSFYKNTTIMNNCVTYLVLMIKEILDSYETKNVFDFLFEDPSVMSLEKMFSMKGTSHNHIYLIFFNSFLNHKLFLFDFDRIDPEKLSTSILYYYVSKIYSSKLLYHYKSHILSIVSENNKIEVEDLFEILESSFNVVEETIGCCVSIERHKDNIKDLGTEIISEAIKDIRNVSGKIWSNIRSINRTRSPENINFIISRTRSKLLKVFKLMAQLYFLKINKNISSELLKLTYNCFKRSIVVENELDESMLQINIFEILSLMGFSISEDISDKTPPLKGNRSLQNLMSKWRVLEDFEISVSNTSFIYNLMSKNKETLMEFSFPLVYSLDLLPFSIFLYSGTIPLMSGYEPLIKNTSHIIGDTKRNESIMFDIQKEMLIHMVHKNDKMFLSRMSNIEPNILYRIDKFLKIKKDKKYLILSQVIDDIIMKCKEFDVEQFLCDFKVHTEFSTIKKSLERFSYEQIHEIYGYGSVSEDGDCDDDDDDEDYDYDDDDAWE